MLTLDEAVANLDELLAPTWEAGLVSAEGSSTQRLRTWTPTALAVRTAVRNVALAVWYATVAPPSNSLSMAAVAENIDRLFPKEDLPHG